MIVTEDQAREMWCPLSRVVFTDNSGKVLIGSPAGNCFDDETGPVGSTCISSRCMFWRDLGGIPEKGYCGAAELPAGWT